MALVVQKYGGTSVGNVEKIKAVAERVIKRQREGNQMVVVLSAMAGQTDGLIELANGISESPDPRELDAIGERIITLARMFNIREGFGAQDDVLPKRCTDEPLGSGPARGQVVELDKLRADYYQLMGWDEKGVPREETLKKLGLAELL